MKITMPIGALAIVVGISAFAQDPDGVTLPFNAVDSSQIIADQQDGNWTMRLRIARPGTAGLQLFIENLRLPAGATLALRQSSDGPAVAEYTGAGPLQGDPFWTTPVTGGEAHLEVRFAAGDAGAMPLEITSVRQLTARGLSLLLSPAEPPPVDAALEGTRGYARFRGGIVPYEIRNGIAYFEGDIVLGAAHEIQPVSVPVSGKEWNARRESMGITGDYYRWPNGVVPYEIDPALPNQARITDAIAHWNTQLSGIITLRPRNGESSYIRYVNTSSSGSCSSYIGYMHQAAQPITIGANCGTGNVIHETGHALGLYHEHTREDRNTFVKILYQNIDPAKTSNFDQAIGSSDDLGAYDYGSIMHYGATAFSINGQPTIETIPPGIPIGQRSALSSGDIGGVKTMYKAASQASVTVSSNPSGAKLVVDGAMVTAPAAFQWAPGSTHTVSAPTITSGNTRNLFKNWSDSGAQTHTVTAPSAVWTITANFQKQYSLTSASSNTALGTTANSPAAADSFYNDGTSVSVSAAPAANACFSGWTGATLPPTTPVAVTVVQPFAITGNFQSGAITAAPAQFTFGAAGGTAQISVSSSGGCAWTAKASVAWITVTSGASGSASGTVGISVSRKLGKNTRTGAVTIGTATVKVQQ